MQTIFSLSNQFRNLLLLSALCHLSSGVASYDCWLLYTRELEEGFANLTKALTEFQADMLKTEERQTEQAERLLEEMRLQRDMLDMHKIFEIVSLAVIGIHFLFTILDMFCKKIFEAGGRRLANKVMQKLRGHRDEMKAVSANEREVWQANDKVSGDDAESRELAIEYTGYQGQEEERLCSDRNRLFSSVDRVRCSNANAEVNYVARSVSQAVSVCTAEEIAETRVASMSC